MAIKTFTTGEVLTASDTNTYLANSGLVYVTSTTIGSAVSSVTISNCFTSTYNDYRITYSGGVASASGSFVLSFGSATTEYYGSYYYDLYTGANTGTVRRNNGANLYVGSTGTTQGRAQTMIDVASPYLAQRTTISGNSYGDGFAGWFAGEQFSATSFTSFTFSLTTGTLTGGTITVYGYRIG